MSINAKMKQHPTEGSLHPPRPVAHIPGYPLGRGGGRRGARFRGAMAALLLGLAMLPWLVGTEAWSAPLRRIGQNPRGLAMGGTGLSYANDEMALFYNPAGMGSIDNFWFELLPISVEASDAALDLVSGGSGGSFDSPSQVIRDNIGKELQFRLLFYPHVLVNLVPGVTIGASVFTEIQTEIELRNQATPQAEAFFREDKGQVIGVSWPSVDGQLLWGIAVRDLERTTGEGSISSADLALASASGELDIETLLDTRTGSGSAFDLGIIWRLQSFSTLRGQFALVAQNVGGLDLGDAGEVPQEIGIGWSFRPRFLPIMPVLFAVELRDITNELSDDSSTAKRTHIGVEVGILPLDQATNLVTFRAGISGSSTSFGIEFSAWHSFTLQYVLYETEFGEAAGEDSRKRTLLQLNILGF